MARMDGLDAIVSGGVWSDSFALDPAVDTVAGQADAVSTLGLYFP